VTLLLASALSFAIVGASGADLATTEYALRQPGLTEANPLLREPLPRYALKVLGTAAVLGVRRELKRRKKDKAARILGVGAIILFSGAAVNNVWRARQAGNQVDGKAP
jgi:hypothetical protein